MTIRMEDAALVIDCSPVVTAALVGSRARRANAAVTEIASRVTLPLSGMQDGYVRVILRDRHGRHAWTNPVWLS